MTTRQDLSPLEQYQGFKRAVETYHHFVQSGNYIGAYVIAFSMLEDRVNAMYAVCYYVHEGNDLPAHQLHTTSFGRKLTYLCDQGDITTVERADWLQTAAERNIKLHNAMWNIDEFTRVDAEAVLRQARVADRLRKVQKRKAGI